MQFVYLLLELHEKRVNITQEDKDTSMSKLLKLLEDIDKSSVSLT
jgi:hypothetical protein